MATMILLPDGQNNVSSDWLPIPFGQTASNALDDDNGATSYVKCNDDAELMNIEFANPSVAEADIDTITSVRFLSSGKAVHRTNPSLVRIAYEAPSGNGSDTCSYDAHRTNFETINGTARTTSDGSSAAWTYANLEDLEMAVIKIGTVEVYLSYLAMEVTYTEAVVADNATFFGANF